MSGRCAALIDELIDSMYIRKPMSFDFKDPNKGLKVVVNLKEGAHFNFSFSLKQKDKSIKFTTGGIAISAYQSAITRLSMILRPLRFLEAHPEMKSKCYEDYSSIVSNIGLSMSETTTVKSEDIVSASIPLNYAKDFIIVCAPIEDSLYFTVHFVKFIGQAKSEDKRFRVSLWRELPEGGQVIHQGSLFEITDSLSFNSKLPPSLCVSTKLRALQMQLLSDGALLSTSE